ncbi:glycoside hydrolase family 71/99-like protein [Paludisphaera mucosa]|uniref:Glycoside hydrolase family 71/99-like protein n=1 Tax=Paludisphaera mucosa TaxID=3030827 RepID=A0ABT6FC16_9BACT|nr:glycoside hydrolase family 71/99-like protein [Paludisphaera mucosa]MDG3005130.1 glycoside hydrolase family 71/99-like protein [Paludisphaera mucosa]
MGRSVLSTMILIPLLGCSPAGPAARAEDAPARPKILVHVMPWFESKAVSGRWGWHWTMGRFDPERLDAAGRREIASHVHPLIGPYDSADPDVLEYQTLLMKVAGIDGAIADWYGGEDVNDYAMIHRRTGALFDALGRRGLGFAVCYEDRVLKAMAEKGGWTPAQAVEHARTHLETCAADWFRRPGYATLDGRPLLLVFGPDYLTVPQWDAAFRGLSPAPAFFTLHERKPPALGAFAWPPMWASKDGVLGDEALDAYLDRFAKQDGPRIPAAFPGFHDIYAQAGVQPSHGFLDARDGATFRRTLDGALRSGTPYVQLVTWNDYGEGTAIEPTREAGYRELETLQGARRKLPGEPFAYRPADLRLPARIYGLRKRLPAADPARKNLDAAADALSAGDAAGAARRIAEAEAAAAHTTGRSG